METTMLACMPRIFEIRLILSKPSVSLIEMTLRCISIIVLSTVGKGRESGNRLCGSNQVVSFWRQYRPLSKVSVLGHYVEVVDCLSWIRHWHSWRIRSDLHLYEAIDRNILCSSIRARSDFKTCTHSRYFFMAQTHMEWVWLLDFQLANVCILTNDLSTFAVSCVLRIQYTSLMMTSDVGPANLQPASHNDDAFIRSHLLKPIHHRIIHALSVSEQPASQQTDNTWSTKTKPASYDWTRRQQHSLGPSSAWKFA